MSAIPPPQGIGPAMAGQMTGLSPTPPMPTPPMNIPPEAATHPMGMPPYGVPGADDQDILDVMPFAPETDEALLLGVGWSIGKQIIHEYRKQLGAKSKRQEHELRFSFFSYLQSGDDDENPLNYCEEAKEEYLKRMQAFSSGE